MHSWMKVSNTATTTAGWTGGVSWTWLSQAVSASKRWIPSMARFTLLRWAVNEDDDDWLARRGTSRSKRCVYCSNIGRTYPMGGCQVAICENCISSKQITAFTTHAVALLEPRAPANVLSQNAAIHTYLVLPAPKETTRSDTGYDGARSQS